MCLAFFVVQVEHKEKNWTKNENTKIRKNRKQRSKYKEFFLCFTILSQGDWERESKRINIKTEWKKPIKSNNKKRKRKREFKESRKRKISIDLK